MERTAHLLKGSASNFAAAKSVQAARHLEKLGRDNDLQEAHAASRALEESPISFRAALEENRPRILSDGRESRNA